MQGKYKFVLPKDEYRMSATMTSIAQQTGVSVAVVSRLLRGDPTLRISEQRRKQILQISTELGGVRSRPRKRKLTQVVVVPVNRIFSPAIVKSILVDTEQFQNFEKMMRTHNFRLHFSFFEPGDEMAMFESMMRAPRSCDGTLILSGVITEPLSQLLQKHRFPHISFDYDAEHFQVNTVRAHAADGLRRAVEHLRQLGHTRIGFVGPRDSYRYPLAVAALAGQSLPLDAELNCWTPNAAEPTRENLRKVTVDPFRQWLQRGPTATAVIASNDSVASGVLDAMRELGIQPGRDLSVVGMDNLEVRKPLGMETPVLTTIDNPTDIIGRRAAELLLNQILHGQTQIVHERIPAELIVRSSTGPCPI